MISALLFISLGAGPLPGGKLIDEHLPGVLSQAKVGEWVTYQFDDGGGRTYYWRIAVVGEEVDSKGRPAVWVELDVGTHYALKAPLGSMKVLAARSLGMTKEGITRFLMGFGVERPKEVEPGDLPKMLSGEDRPAPKAAPAQTTVKQGTASRLVTLGGTVTATPIEVRLGETAIKRFWLCDQIPILKVAKIELPPIAHSMEARDWGLDAKAQMASPDPAAAKIRMESAQ